MPEDKKIINKNELDEKQLDQVSGGVSGTGWEKTGMDILGEKDPEFQKLIDAKK